MSQQPGSNNDAQDELSRLRAQLAAKDAQLKDMEQKLQGDADTAAEGQTSGVAQDDEPESKLPPVTDVTLSVKGVAEYDSFPFSVVNKKFVYMASLKAPYFRTEDRAPIDLVAVVDESGSMRGARMRLVKETMQFIIKNLEPNDRFGIVGYSNGARTVLPLTNMDTKGRENASECVRQLRTTGGTALCAGLVAGVNMMRNRKIKNDVASVMILTDGQANQGPRNPQQIIASVRSGSVGKITKVPKPPPPQSLLNRLPVNPPAAPQGEGAPPTIATSDEELPCTINTFGFGTGHNENLLEAIADEGRGMYAFIKSVDMIADTFAECLGGLVSIIAQNLSIRVEGLNNVQINKCLSTGYTTKADKLNKIYTVQMKDLQSEEGREILFELTLPTVPVPTDAQDLVRLSVTYENVVKGKQETLTQVCHIKRVASQEIGERSVELDLQYNRILAADAMEEAGKLGDAGQLQAARQVLDVAAKHIMKSKTSSDNYSKNLVSDIRKVEQNMASQQQYRSHASKQIKMNKKAHKMQRSVQSSAYESQNAYMNRSKVAMKRKFKR